MAQRNRGNRLNRQADTLSTLRDVLSEPAIRGLAFEVITRLSARRADDWAVPNDEMQHLIRALCARYPYAAHRLVNRLVDSGVPLSRIYYTYLGEAARRLGVRWQTDHASFEEVSVATARIYLIIDDIRRRMPAPLVPRHAPRLIFSAVPGEQHTLGVEMATDLFRREGWDVTHLIDMDHDQIIAAAEDADVVLMGLSASGRRQRAALLRLVVALRVVRPDLKILLSGAITEAEPNLIAQIGIDSVVREVSDALEAVPALVPPQTATGG